MMKGAPVLKSIFGAAIAIHLLLSTQASLAAEAACRSDSGIASEVIAPIDVGHLRKTLADAGFTVGGFYLGETFGNTGGIQIPIRMLARTDSGVMATCAGDDIKEGRAPIAKVAGPTKFSALVDKTAADLGCSKIEAARRVRQEYPDIAHGYDDLTSESYRSLVEAEIRKGFSPTVAAQRVCHLYPDAAQASISKRDDSDVAEFMSKVDRTMQREGISRTEAMAQVRKANPTLFKRFQEV